MVDLFKENFLKKLKSLLSEYDAELYIEDKRICFYVDGMENGEVEYISDIKDNNVSSITYLDINV